MQSNHLTIDDDQGGLRLLYLAREISHSSNPTTGAERRVAAFLDEFRAGAVKTLTYLAPAHAPQAKLRSSTPGWQKLPLPVRGLRRDLARLAGAIWFIALNLRSIRRFRPSVVLERAAYLDPTGALIAHILGIPHVLELHGDLAADSRGYYTSPLAPFGTRYEARRYRRSARTIVVSHGLADRLEADGVSPSRIAVIPNGVSPIMEPPSRQLARGRWGVGERSVVGWIGYLMPWQLEAFDDLVSGLNDVDQRHPLALVVVAPPAGATTRALERLQSSARFPIVLTGEANGAAADEAVAGFDIGIIPAARAYDLPVKLFHYGMLGVAVVAPNTRSIRELDGGAGLLYLFDPGDAARTVERALGDPRRAENAGRFRRFVEERHTWPVVVGDVLSVCRSVAVVANSAPLRARR